MLEIRHQSCRRSADNTFLRRRPAVIFIMHCTAAPAGRRRRRQRGSPETVNWIGLSLRRRRSPELEQFVNALFIQSSCRRRGGAVASSTHSWQRFRRRWHATSTTTGLAGGWCWLVAAHAGSTYVKRRCRNRTAGPAWATVAVLPSVWAVAANRMT